MWPQARCSCAGWGYCCLRRRRTHWGVCCWPHFVQCKHWDVLTLGVTVNLFVYVFFFFRTRVWIPGSTELHLKLFLLFYFAARYCPVVQAGLCYPYFNTAMLSLHVLFFGLRIFYLFLSDSLPRSRAFFGTWKKTMPLSHYRKWGKACSPSDCYSLKIVAFPQHLETGC